MNWYVFEQVHISSNSIRSLLLDISRWKCDPSATWLVIIVIYIWESVLPRYRSKTPFWKVLQKSKFEMLLKLWGRCLPADNRKMIKVYEEKRIKAPSLDMNNTEQISVKVGALPHSTQQAVWRYAGIWLDAVVCDWIPDWARASIQRRAMCLCCLTRDEAVDMWSYVCGSDRSERSDQWSEKNHELIFLPMK